MGFGHFCASGGPVILIFNSPFPLLCTKDGSSHLRCVATRQKRDTIRNLHGIQQAVHGTLLSWHLQDASFMKLEFLSIGV